MDWAIDSCTPYVYVADANIFKKSSNKLTIPCAIRVTGSEFHTDDPQTLGATVKHFHRYDQHY
jgi:hypothetical protein